MKKRKRVVLYSLVFLFVGITVGLMLLSREYTVYCMRSDLMHPKIYPGDIVLLDRDFKTDRLQPGDIIAFTATYEGKRRTFLRRIVGRPGDAIILEGDGDDTLEDGERIRLNEWTIPVSLLPSDLEKDLADRFESKAAVTVPNDRYFVWAVWSTLNDKRQRFNGLKNPEQLKGKYIGTLTRLFRREPLIF